MVYPITYLSLTNYQFHYEAGSSLFPQVVYSLVDHLKVLWNATGVMCVSYIQPSDSINGSQMKAALD